MNDLSTVDRQTLARIEAKLDEVLALRDTLNRLAGLIDLIPNPLVRKMIRGRIEVD